MYVNTRISYFQLTKYSIFDVMVFPVTFVTYSSPIVTIHDLTLRKAYRGREVCLHFIKGRFKTVITNQDHLERICIEVIDARGAPTVSDHFLTDSDISLNISSYQPEINVCVSIYNELQIRLL